MTGQLLQPILPGITNLNLDQYLKIPNNLDPTKILNKLVEATTDALFNLPAVLTVQEWTKKAPSYLYSFEYLGKKTSGSHFLSGLPLVNKSKSTDKVAHGDELGYLFDANDIFGNPIEKSKVSYENYFIFIFI